MTPATFPRSLGILKRRLVPNLVVGLILIQCTNGFSRHRFRRHPLSVRASTPRAEEATAAEESSWLNRKMGGKIKVGLMVEPTPFTHVSGYANRFNEMLKNLRKAGDDVEVITPDNEDNGAAPREVHGHRVNNLKGFKFPMYPLITLTFDLKARAISIMNRFRPDILHVSTPSCTPESPGILHAVQVVVDFSNLTPCVLGGQPWTVPPAST